MEIKKYIIIVTENPFGKQINGSEEKPASSYILNNKIYNSYNEADDVLSSYKKSNSFENLEKTMSIPYDDYCEIRKFIINNLGVTLNGEYRESNDTKKMISLFNKLYDYDYKYSNYENDEKIFQKITFENEPILKIVEIADSDKQFKERTDGTVLRFASNDYVLVDAIYKLGGINLIDGNKIDNKIELDFECISQRSLGIISRSISKKFSKTNGKYCLIACSCEDLNEKNLSIYYSIKTIEKAETEEKFREDVNLITGSLRYWNEKQFEKYF